MPGHPGKDTRINSIQNHYPSSNLKVFSFRLLAPIKETHQVFVFFFVFLLVNLNNLTIRMYS